MMSFNSAGEGRQVWVHSSCSEPDSHIPIPRLLERVHPTRFSRVWICRWEPKVQGSPAEEEWSPVTLRPVHCWCLLDLLSSLKGAGENDLKKRQGKKKERKKEKKRKEKKNRPKGSRKWKGNDKVQNAEGRNGRFRSQRRSEGKMAKGRERAAEEHVGACQTPPPPSVRFFTCSHLSGFKS